MKLTNMKVSAEREEGYLSQPSKVEAPRYPYGLAVNLDTEALEKLGFTAHLPSVGESLKLTALVDVTSVSEHESQGGGRSCSCTLQITDMALKAESSASSDKLYKKA